MRHSITILLLLAIVGALSSCVDTSKSPRLECAVESVVSVPSGVGYIVVLPTGERLFYCSGAYAVLLPPLPAATIEAGR